MEALDNPIRRAGNLKLAILVNTIAPYRLPIYIALSEAFETYVMHGGMESNRSWKIEPTQSLRTQKVFTVQIRVKKKTGAPGISDTSRLHINAGLLWWLPRIRPDVIISNELGVRTIVAMLYARVAGIPLLVWWGGTRHSEANIGKWKMRYRRFLARQVPHWISYGATSTEYIQTLGVPRDKVLQIQNCIPHELFIRQAEPSKLWFQGQPTPVILSVGQLIARKGLDKLIAACGRLQAAGTPCTLMIVGNGPEKNALQRLAEIAGLTNFHLLPNQSQETLAELYRQATVFVFPTMEDVWGLVVNEALWAGCPVLCSKYAGCAGEIVPYENVFDPLSNESFDAALQSVLDGTIRQPDATRLMTCSQVSGLILQTLKQTTGTN